MTPQRREITRVAIVMRGALDVALSSGTAIAVIGLRRALAAAGVRADVFDMRTSAFARVALRRSGGPLYDAVLGVDGAGYQLAGAADVPFVVLVKAFYAGTLQHERPAVRLALLRSLAIELKGARRADAVVVPSNFAAAAVREAYGLEPDRVHVVPEPFDLGAWRAALPVRVRTGTRVLCVAHLYPRKRVADLLDAWPLVHARRPHARLDVVGAGPELRALERRGRDLPACYLHGFTPPAAVTEFYARADAFCLPSAQETFGYSVVEAMGSALPVVVGDAGALPELLRGAVGEAVPVGDVQRLAEAVLRSLEPSNRAAAARRNPQRARTFAPSTVAAQLLEVVRQAAQRRAAGSVARRSGWLRNSSTVARIWSLRAASESAKNPPS